MKGTNKKRRIGFITLLLLVLLPSLSTKPKAFTDYATATMTNTAYVTEPASQSGSIVTYNISSIQVASLSSTGPSDVQTFFSNWSGQINADDTTSGTIAIDAGSNTLPLSSPAWMNCVTTINTVGYTSGTFTGPKGTFTLNGSMQAPIGFSASNMYVPNISSGSVSFYANLSGSSSTPFTSAVDGNSFSFSNYGFSSSSAYVNKWGSTPSGLRQKQSYYMSLGSIQYDAVSNYATASTSVAIN